MAVEDRVHSFVEHEAERDVQPRDKGDRQHEGGVEDVLRLPRPFPVEVVPRRGRAPLGLPNRLGDCGYGEPRRRHERLLGTGADDVDPPRIISIGKAPRLETASTTIAPEGRMASACACRSDDAGRRLGVRQQHGAGVAELGELRGDVLRPRDLPPLVAESGDLAAVPLGNLDPALAEGAGGDDEDAAAGSAQIRDGGLHGAGPGGGEQQNIGRCPADLLQAIEALAVDRQKVVGAMVDDRSADRRQHLRGHRGRPGREEVALGSHLTEPSERGRCPLSPVCLTLAWLDEAGLVGEDDRLDAVA